MSLLTDFLKLFKWDTTSETDLDEEFDVDKAMNENWDKIDAKAKEHDDSINTLEDVQAEQSSSIQKLKESMINISTEEATSLYVNDAGTPPAQLRIKGNHKQDGTPTLENPIEIETVKNEVNVVVSNKNLIRLVPAQTKNYSGLDVTVDEEGIVTLNGTATGFFPTFLLTGDTIKTNSGTPNISNNPDWYSSMGLPNDNYTFKFEHISGTGGNEYRPYFFIHSKTGGNSNPTQGNTTKVKTYSGTVGGISFYVDTGNVFENYKFRIMLVKGTYTLTNFPDHVKHEEIKKTLDIQQEKLKGDDFDLENNKEVHNWKKYTITNINEFTNVTKEGSTFRFIKNVTNGNQISDVICNMCKKWNNSWSETGCFISYDSKFYLMIKFGDYGFTEAMTVDEAKTHMNEFLSITSLVFYYTTSTTTQLDLTTEQKEVLAQLNNLDLFKGINNIYTEEGIALMQLDYSADTKMYIDKLVGSEG